MNKLAEEKPTAAFVLSLIGGIFIIIGGLYIAAIGALFTFLIGGIGAVFGVVGIVFGILVLLGAVMMYSKPEQHSMWGAIVLVFSIIALPAAWGFGIGSLLGFIGGILGLVFKPKGAAMMAPPPPPPGA